MSRLNTSPVTENYDHIELSDIEINEALRLLRKQKHHKIETENYWKKINQPVEYPKLDFIQTSSSVFRILNESCKGDFILNEHNERVINLLSLYFSGDKRFEDESDFSLKKGIFLVGPIGCGKTSIMKAFAKNSYNAFVIASTRSVSDEYSKSGIDGVARFFESVQVYPQNNYGQKEAGYCFDDLGVETTKKHFGNELNVMTDIILSRYEKSNLIGKTHFTGNIMGDEIEETYGARVRSRLREMCNFIAFDPQSSDFRK